MKEALLLLSLASGLVAHAAQAASSVNLAFAPQSRNSISCTVFGVSRSPVADVVIELLDDLGVNIYRGKTDASGRFIFSGLVSGRYKVRVLPYGTDYLEQLQDVTLSSVSVVPGGGSDNQLIDIYLRLDERLTSGPFTIGPSVIFAQEVPKEAKKHYEAGYNFLREKKEAEAFASLRKAIEIFPDYFAALDRLGREYSMRGTNDRKYLEAGRLILSKAFEVNPRNGNTAFCLGWAEYQLGLTNQAIETLRKASTLYSKSPDVYLWLGRALKRAAKPDQAETTLLRANELADGKSADVHWHLAGLYNDQKKFKEAADQLELFLKHQPKAADAEKIKVMIKQLRDKVAAVQ